MISTVDPAMLAEEEGSVLSESVFHCIEINIGAQRRWGALLDEFYRDFSVSLEMPHFIGIVGRNDGGRKMTPLATREEDNFYCTPH